MSPHINKRKECDPNEEEIVRPLPPAIDLETKTVLRQLARSHRALAELKGSPYEFDFISLHTSHHPAVHIGWFGTDEDLLLMKSAGRESDRFHENNPVKITIQQLHADVICLKGAEGILKEMMIKPLKSQSGVILHGITLATKLNDYEVKG